jgi:hypothetical protein
VDLEVARLDAAQLAATRAVDSQEVAFAVAAASMAEVVSTAVAVHTVAVDVGKLYREVKI